MVRKTSIAVRFGGRLRALRLQAGLTQEQLAESADVSVNFVSLVERGVKSPTLATMERLAAALKVPLADLFRFDSGSDN